MLLMLAGDGRAEPTSRAGCPRHAKADAFETAVRGLFLAVIYDAGDLAAQVFAMHNHIDEAVL